MTDSLFDSQIKLIRQGDKQGLKEIYSEYGTMIYTIMLSAVKILTTQRILHLIFL